MKTKKPAAAPISPTLKLLLDAKARVEADVAKYGRPNFPPNATLAQVSDAWALRKRIFSQPVKSAAPSSIRKPIAAAAKGQAAAPSIAPAAAAAPVVKPPPPVSDRERCEALLKTERCPRERYRIAEHLNAILEGASPPAFKTRDQLDAEEAAAISH
jgi:hypothetical protein